MGRVFGGESFETLNAALIKDENLDLEDIIDFVGDYR
jgi:hypothetical protein